jgi:hypothetical protein
MTWIELPKRGGSGGGGSGTPGGSGSGEVQYNQSGTFTGDSEFRWDQNEKFIFLNGLAVRALSSQLSLVDNVNVATTITQWPTSYRHTVIDFSLDRGSETLTGTLLIANTNVSVKLTPSQVDTSESGDGGLGITFSATIQGGNTVLLQYTSTSTGQNASMQIAARQW